MMKMTSPYSLFSRVGSLHLQRSVIHDPPCVPPFSQLPAVLFLCLSCPPTRRHFLPELYLGHSCVSKLHASETPLVWTCCYGEGLAEPWPGGLIPRNGHTIAQQQWLRFYGKSQHVMDARVCCLPPVYLFLYQ